MSDNKSLLAEAPNTAIVPMQITPLAMIQAAIERGAGLDMVQQLMALSERIEANQARRAFDEAISAAKAEIQPIIKNREVDFPSKSANGRTNYRHEDLAQIARQVDPILSRHGLSYRFRTTNAPNEPVSVTCIVSHRLGHSEENTLSGPRDDSGSKNAIQAVGSAITYLQRYTLKAALGLSVTNDDDGRSSGDPAGAALITDEQANALRASIDDAGANIAAFCRFFKIDKVGDLPAARLSEAQRAIADHKARAR